MGWDPIARGATDAASSPVDFEPHTETLQKDPTYYESPGTSHAGEVTKKPPANGNTGGLPPVYSGQRIGGAKDFTQGGSGDGEGNPGNTGGGGGSGGGGGGSNSHSSAQLNGSSGPLPAGFFHSRRRDNQN